MLTIIIAALIGFAGGYIFAPLIKKNQAGNTPGKPLYVSSVSEPIVVSVQEIRDSIHS